MRQVVADGNALGLFAEGSRQRSGVPGVVQPGAAMVALQEGAPIVPVAIHGTQVWRLGGFQPVSIAWGETMTFDGLPKGGKGYKEASVLVQAEIRRLWDWLVEVHRLGRPAGSPLRRALEDEVRWRQPASGSPARLRSSASRTSASRPSSTG